MDTSGFYSLLTMEPGDYIINTTQQHAVVLYAPNFVYAPDYTLMREKKDSYTYPTHGWYYFDSKEAMMEGFGVTELPPLEVPDAT